MKRIMAKLRDEIAVGVGDQAVGKLVPVVVRDGRRSTVVAQADIVDIDLLSSSGQLDGKVS